MWRRRQEDDRSSALREHRGGGRSIRASGKRMCFVEHH
jgi:hypothetical protein